jgi:hypothetical protein
MLQFFFVVLLAFEGKTFPMVRRKQLLLQNFLFAIWLLEYKLFFNLFYANYVGLETNIFPLYL